MRRRVLIGLILAAAVCVSGAASTVCARNCTMNCTTIGTQQFCNLNCY